MDVMKRFMAVGALLAALACGAADGDFLLLWQIDEPDIERIGGGSTPIADFTVKGSTVNRVQVGVTDTTTGKLVEYLELWSYNGETAVAENLHTTAMILPDVEGDYCAGPTYANIGDYRDPKYTFAIELGNYNNGQFNVMAKSESYTYAMLQADPNDEGVNHITAGELFIPSYLAWTGARYVEAQASAVPEPSGGLLLLVGASLLALRRRRAV